MKKYKVVIYYMYILILSRQNGTRIYVNSVIVIGLLYLFFSFILHLYINYIVLQ